MADPPAIVRAFANAVHAVLGDRLVGVYLGGSYAMGDFIDGSSDYDLMVVVDAPLDRRDVEMLERAHATIAGLPGFERLEGDYAPQAWLTPTGTSQPVDWFRAGRIRAERELMLSADNIANMREQGIVVFGEPPTNVLPRVSIEDVRAAVRAMLADQDASATERQAADEIVSLLRSMRALETGGPTTKSDGIRWGLEHLAPDRRVLIQEADRLRRGGVADETRSTLRDALTALRRQLL